ncbi:hypothetical protein EIN_177600 [Entamoeba invadens IP1]|uniref:hypothetical protein n=1 Tax=Entamoeba invadens IP1 TaxID=370355 RepID=UPI0002C3F190|nr:hypothetical protein EIN_177600 [Entamoeba invadens IP1]ELP93873.1 hypothetical protein EIN_177600 [Entamoeba invadens IP1]|eukprot:XP_004260644.1 hypothetical protein EIN_177600 [Entamoeba invadens IP1]
MFTTTSEQFLKQGRYPLLPKDVQTTGYYKTPYVLVNPSNTNQSDSIIIFCHRVYSSLSTSLTSANLLAEITGLPVLCFEYPGFYPNTTFSKASLLCALLDIYQFSSSTLHKDGIYIVGDLEGCYPAMHLVDCLRKQKQSLSGVILLNPIEVKASRYKCMKFKGCIVCSDEEPYKRKSRKLARKFCKCKEVILKTSKLDILNEETDEVLKCIIALIKMEMVDLKELCCEELIIQKPQQYYSPIEIVTGLVGDTELATLLLTNGYFSAEIIALMTTDEINNLKLCEKHKKIVSAVIQQLNSRSSPTPLSPLSTSLNSPIEVSIESSSTCSPRHEKMTKSSTQFFTKPVRKQKSVDNTPYISPRKQEEKYLFPKEVKEKQPTRLGSFGSAHKLSKSMNPLVPIFHDDYFELVVSQNDDSPKTARVARHVI